MAIVLIRLLLKNIRPKIQLFIHLLLDFLQLQLFPILVEFEPLVQFIWLVVVFYELSRGLVDLRFECTLLFHQFFRSVIGSLLVGVGSLFEVLGALHEILNHFLLGLILLFLTICAFKVIELVPFVFQKLFAH